MRSPAGISRIGSWKTTRSIGRECKAGDRLSRPVLTAERLDHPDPTPSHERATIADGPSPPLPTILVSQQAFSRSNGDRRVEWSTHPNPRSCIDHAHPESRATRLNALAARFPGDHTRGATPVPIPNTAVKPAGPMIVQSRESRSSPGPIPDSPAGSTSLRGYLLRAPHRATRTEASARHPRSATSRGSPPSARPGRGTPITPREPTRPIFLRRLRFTLWMRIRLSGMVVMWPLGPGSRMQCPSTMRRGAGTRWRSAT